MLWRKFFIFLIFVFLAVSACNGDEPGTVEEATETDISTRVGILVIDEFNLNPNPEDVGEKKCIVSLEGPNIQSTDMIVDGTSVFIADGVGVFIADGVGNGYIEGVSHGELVYEKFSQLLHESAYEKNNDITDVAKLQEYLDITFQEDQSSIWHERIG
nr:hypothetical protein [Ardenticatenaceae bacterium]